MPVSDDDGKEAVPVWPHERFPEACAGQWPKSEPRTIELSTWLNQWIPGMTNNNRLAAAFPTPDGNGVLVSPSRLKSDLQKEILLIE